MLVAAISIPAHSSKESHAIFMQYWWGAVTPSQLIHSYPELEVRSEFEPPPFALQCHYVWSVMPHGK
jgi:hypothetical protein